MHIQRFLVKALAFALAASMCSGCTNRQATTRLSDAATAYEAGEYETAHIAAVEVMHTGNFQQQGEAAYIAGLSSYQAGDFVRAETEMQRAVRSSDPETVGRASAMLGAIRLEQDRPADAADYYRAAVHNLEGDEAQRAAKQAALAYDRTDQSVSNASTARPSTYDVASDTFTVRPRFCLQVGVFRETNRAQDAASSVQDVAARFGLSPVRIVETADVRGRPLQFVQMGSFPSRREAEAARRRLDRLDIIVAPLRDDN